MKKIALAVLACLVVFGCSVTRVKPVVYTDNSGKKFDILGGIELKMDKNHYGYTEILAAAKAKYPDCDYVIDIMIDDNVAFTYIPVINWYLPKENDYIVRATAVKYKRGE